MTAGFNERTEENNTTGYRRNTRFDVENRYNNEDKPKHWTTFSNGDGAKQASAFSIGLKDKTRKLKKNAKIRRRMEIQSKTEPFDFKYQGYSSGVYPSFNFSNSKKYENGSGNSSEIPTASAAGESDTQESHIRGKSTSNETNSTSEHFHIGISLSKSKNSRRDQIRHRIRMGRSKSKERNVSEEHTGPLPYEIPLPPSPTDENKGFFTDNYEEILLDQVQKVNINEKGGLTSKKKDSISHTKHSAAQKHEPASQKHSVPQNHAPAAKKTEPLSQTQGTAPSSKQFCSNHANLKAAVGSQWIMKCKNCKIRLVMQIPDLVFCEPCAIQFNTCSVHGCSRNLDPPRRKVVVAKKPLRNPAGASEPSKKEPNPAWMEYKKLGGHAYNDGDFARSIEYYSKSLDSIEFSITNGSNPSLLVEKAKLYSNRAAALMMVDKVKEALVDSQASITADSTYLRAHLRLAKCHLLLANTIEAKSTYKNAHKFLRSNSDDPQMLSYTAQVTEGLKSVKLLESHLRQAKAYREGKNYKMALNRIELAMEIAMSSRELKAQKMTLLISMSEYNQAESYCDSLVAKGGTSHVLSLGIELALLYARALYYNSKTREANDVLAELERVAPTSGDILKLKALWKSLQDVRTAANESFKAGKYNDAINLYSKALTIDSEFTSYNATMHGNRAAGYMALKLYFKAIDDCSMAIMINPRYLKVIIRRARCYRALKQFKESINDIDTYLASEKLPFEEVRAIRQERNEIEEEWEEARKPKTNYNEYYDSWNDNDDNSEFNFRSNYHKHSNRSNESGGAKYKNRPKAGRRDPRQKSQHLAPPPAPVKTHYDILNVPSTATNDEIKKSYRKLALKHHPDKAKTTKDAELFKEMTAAYSLLSDPREKAKYDAELRYGVVYN